MERLRIATVEFISREEAISRYRDGAISHNNVVPTSTETEEGGPSSEPVPIVVSSPKQGPIAYGEFNRALADRAAEAIKERSPERDLTPAMELVKTAT
jgi:hypothetical protein